MDGTVRILARAVAGGKWRQEAALIVKYWILKG